MSNTQKMRIAVITGGTKGIGHQLCESFNQAGYKTYALDNALHIPLSDGITFLQADLRSEEDIQKAFDTVRSKQGAIHVLINNGAIAYFMRPITEIQVSELDDIFDTNLRGAFLCCKAFVEANKNQDYGRIINIASTRWHQNEAHWEAYGTTKGGLVSLTNSLTVSLSDTSITVNAISPGYIETGDYDALSPEDHAQHPSRRVGKPIDIANACLFLCQEDNDFINGCNLIIDGGMSKRMIYT